MTIRGGKIRGVVAETSNLPRSCAVGGLLYVKTADVIGVEEFKKVVLDTIVLISKRQMHPFETIEQAKDRLAEQK